MKPLIDILDLSNQPNLIEEIMKSVSRDEIHPIKMATNPPEVIINAGMKVINMENKFIYEYVGIGWIKLEEATMEDYKNIPQLI
jgi:hypothetical protein